MIEQYYPVSIYLISSSDSRSWSIPTLVLLEYSRNLYIILFLFFSKFDIARKVCRFNIYIYERLLTISLYPKERTTQSITPQTDRLQTRTLYKVSLFGHLKRLNVRANFGTTIACHVGALRNKLISYKEKYPSVLTHQLNKTYNLMEQGIILCKMQMRSDRSPSLRVAMHHSA